MHWHDCVDLGVHSKPSGPHPSQCGPAQLRRSDFSSHRGRPELCFPTLTVPELVMCKLFKIYLSSRNVQCLKVLKEQSNFLMNVKEVVIFITANPNYTLSCWGHFYSSFPCQKLPIFFFQSLLIYAQSWVTFAIPISSVFYYFSATLLISGFTSLSSLIFC